MNVQLKETYFIKTDIRKYTQLEKKMIYSLYLPLLHSTSAIWTNCRLVSLAGSCSFNKYVLNREENILVFISGTTVKTFFTFTSFHIDFFVATRLSWQHNSTSLKGKETASWAFHWSNWCVSLCTHDFV